ncbi:hypothetical protein OG338_26230 [Streptomyces sp. NBC_00726]|uniref:hypothetical protein n=1 Tax=Streptomyces sp. NBC_00726 TaxID=2903674 RepID=UPI0038650477
MPTPASTITSNLDVYRFDPDRVAGLLEQAGFAVRARLVRAAGPDERTPQAFLLARRRSRVR